jgi:hypothetical protein
MLFIKLYSCCSFLYEGNSVRPMSVSRLTWCAVLDSFLVNTCCFSVALTAICLKSSAAFVFVSFFSTVTRSVESGYKDGYVSGLRRAAFYLTNVWVQPTNESRIPLVCSSPGCAQEQVPSRLSNLAVTSVVQSEAGALQRRCFFDEVIENGGYARQFFGTNGDYATSRR